MIVRMTFACIVQRSVQACAAKGECEVAGGTWVKTTVFDDLCEASVGGVCCGASTASNCVEKAPCEKLGGKFAIQRITCEPDTGSNKPPTLKVDPDGVFTRGVCGMSKALCTNTGGRWKDDGRTTGEQACSGHLESESCTAGGLSQCCKFENADCKSKIGNAKCSAQIGADRIDLLCCRKDMQKHCITKADCEAKGIDGTWNQGKRDGVVVGHCCGSTNIAGCVTQSACEKYGFEWYPQTGCTEPSAELTTTAECCTTSALDGCATEMECKSVGGTWSVSDKKYRRFLFEPPSEQVVMKGCCGTGFEAGCHTKAHCEAVKGTWVGHEMNPHLSPLYGSDMVPFQAPCIQGLLWSSEVSVPAGLASTERCKGVQLTDMDGDGDQDVVLLVGKLVEGGLKDAR